MFIHVHNKRSVSIMKDKELIVLDRIQQTVLNCTKKPENYLRYCIFYINAILSTRFQLNAALYCIFSIQKNIAQDLKSSTKDLYDLAFKKKSFKSTTTHALPELIIDGFDAEQIWQQLELENNEEFSQVGIEKLSKALASKKWDLPLRTSALSDNENDEKSVHSESEMSKNSYENDEILDDHSAEEVLRKNTVTKLKKKKSSSELDDKFFKIDELNRFLRMEDEKESGNGKKVDSEDEELESIDLFNNIPDSEDEDNSEISNGQSLKYADFFDCPENDDDDDDEQNAMDNDDCKDSDIEESSDHEDENSQVEDSNENSHQKMQSSLEIRKDRLEKRIHQLEDQAVCNKPWQLKGEVSSKERPVNSLLEEFVEFDQVTRPAPVMTEQTTMKLEDIIRSRIKDRAWDDVEKKVKPVETPMEYKKKLIMNQEKSKESLAQIYENEYIKQREALTAADDKEEQPEEPPEHNIIRELMHSLFTKLDALSNFHYTPKPVSKLNHASYTRIIHLLPVCLYKL